MRYTSAQMGPHTDTQHNKNSPLLCDTLVHRWDHIQTHTAQQEQSIIMRYTST
jgi:hypothetical protein